MVNKNEQPVANKVLRKLSQDELNKIIARHKLFRRGAAGGVRANLSQVDLSHLTLAGQDMSHADFTGSVLYGTVFEGATMDYCLFFGADLRDANFREASLVRADLRGACLRGAMMTNADLTDADLREGAFARYDAEAGLSFVSESQEWKDGVGSVDMRGATLASAKLSGAVAINSNFEDANLSKATFVHGDFSGANLAGANLAGADLSNCVLKDVNLRGANLAGTLMDVSNLDNVDMTGALTDRAAGKTVQDLAMTLEQMALLHKMWLDTKGASGAMLMLNGFDMRGAPPLTQNNLTMMHAEESIWYEYNFSHMNMQAGQFKKCSMRGCIFDGADIRSSNFAGANLVSSRFIKTRFDPLVIDGKKPLKSDFRDANLRYANFREANLQEVNFTGADLSFADFTGADITGAVFKDAIMDKTKIKFE